MPKDYHAFERLWYVGTKENLNKTYITEPYIDAMTGNMWIVSVDNWALYKACK